MGKQHNKPNQKSKSQQENQDFLTSTSSLGNQHYGKKVHPDNEREKVQNLKPYQHNPQTDIQPSGPSLGNQQYGHTRATDSKQKNPQNPPQPSTSHKSSGNRRQTPNNNAEDDSEQKQQATIDHEPKENPSVQVAKNERNITENQRNQDPTLNQNNLEEY